MAKIRRNPIKRVWIFKNGYTIYYHSEVINMAKSKPKKDKPEEKVTLDLTFQFDDDPTSENSLCTSAIITQLNLFKNHLLEYDYRGFSPCAIQHVFHIEFEPAEVSPQEWDQLYEAFNISHRRTKHPYRDIDTPTLHQQLQRMREERDKKE